AALILEYHQAHPGTPIMLYAHSAGCTVATTALERLPAGLVGRAVLLSPSLSARYNLKPALANVRRSLHVFYSRRDWCYLGMSTWLVGTADRRFDRCGGRTGFQIDPGQLEPGLASKLFQRAWQPGDRELGNNGGHYGNYQPNF